MYFRRPEIPKTPTRTAPSMVDMAAQLRAQMTPYSAAESRYSTPPSSSPLVELHTLNVEELRASITTPTCHPGRRAPLPQLNQAPATPQNRVPLLPDIKFTPFHDLKKTIDDWIGDLPAEFQGLIEPDDEIFVERRKTNNGTQLSLFLCSPTKKGKPVPNLDGDDTPTRGSRTRDVDNPLSSIQHQVQLGTESLHFSQSEDETVNATSSAPKRHRSLLRKTGRVLKKTIRLLIPNGVLGRPGRRTAALPETGEESYSSPESALPTTTRIHPNRQFLYRPDSARVPGAGMTKDSAPLIVDFPQRPSAFPLPTITATEPLPFSSRSPRDITSTIRKPVATHHRASSIPRPRTLPIKTLTALQSPAKISVGNIERSERGSFYDLVALQAEGDLSSESREVKAVASLSVMAMAAGADFLREDELFHATAVGKRKGNVRKGGRRQVRMPS